MLGSEWISLKDFCALLAGFCPLEPLNGGWGNPDEKRRYKSNADGEEVKTSKADFEEMGRYAEKFFVSGADIRAGQKNPNIIDGNDAEVSVRWAFEVALGFRPVDDRVVELYNTAVDE